MALSITDKTILIIGFIAVAFATSPYAEQTISDQPGSATTSLSKLEQINSQLERLDNRFRYLNQNRFENEEPLTNTTFKEEDLATETTLQQIQGTDFASETTLADLNSDFNQTDFAQETSIQELINDFNNEDFASETTLQDINQTLDNLEGKDYATETTLQDIKNNVAQESTLQDLDNTDFATETTLANLDTNFQNEDFAQDTTLQDLINDFNNEDFASETTLSEIKTDFNQEDFATESTLEEFEENFDETKGLFGGVDVNNRQNLFHIEPTVPLNERRSDWTGNLTWTGSTYKLTGNSRIETNQRGEYQPGSTAEAGQMVIVDQPPQTGDEDMKWLYFNGDDGFYFGVNTTCTYVGIKKNGEVLDEVCQENWNVNTVNTTSETSYNPSGEKLDINDVVIYQSQYAWYGAGVIEMAIIFDDETGQDTVVVHRFDIENQTSVGETSLPIKAEVYNDSDNSTSLEVGGRQYSILDNYERTARQTKVFTESVTVSSTEYTPAVSVRILEDFSNVNLDLLSFAATPECDVNAQIRYDTSLTGASWQEPELVQYNETLLEVDKSASSWQVGGEASGEYLDFAQLPAGENKNKPAASSFTEQVASVIGDEDIVTLAFKADDTSCSVTDITVQMEEDF